MDEIAYLFDKFKLKIVLFTVLIVVFISYSKYAITNDLPPCPHAVSIPLELRPRGCRGHKPCSLDLARLKTGDIIMLSYGGLRSVFGAVFYNSIWVHTGIVYVDSKTREIYIFEAANYFPPYIGEVVRIPILKWMKINRNVMAAAILPINREISDEMFGLATEKYENVKVTVESLRHTWLRFLRTKKICDLPDNHIFSDKFNPKNVAAGHVFDLTCHELTIGALQEAGVVEHSITPCSFFPSTVYNRRFNCINGFRYAAPKQVSFHEHVGDLVNSIEY